MLYQEPVYHYIKFCYLCEYVCYTKFRFTIINAYMLILRSPQHINAIIRVLIVNISFILIMINNAYAHDKGFHKNKLNVCHPSKVAKNDYEPEIFHYSNNLLRKSTETAVYCGKKIIIHGKVLDKNCIPVPDVKVYIWQVGCSGHYHYTPLKNRVNHKLFNLNQDSSFIGNGVAITNNKGEFHFITVYPSKVHGLPAHVNIRVKHRLFDDLQTRLYLKGHSAPDPLLDAELEHLAKYAVENDISIYDFNITLKGEGIHK